MLLYETAPPASAKHLKHDPVESTLDSNSIRFHLSLPTHYSGQHNEHRKALGNIC